MEYKDFVFKIQLMVWQDGEIKIKKLEEIQ